VRSSARPANNSRDRARLNSGVLRSAGGRLLDLVGPNDDKGRAIPVVDSGPEPLGELADLADAARQGDGDREVVDERLREWDAVATATGAPHLEVQLRYAKAILADEGNAEPFFEDAMSVGAAGWPFYAARAVGVRRLAQTAAPHGRVAGAAA
jgi:hypothetical protein